MADKAVAEHLQEVSEFGNCRAKFDTPVCSGMPNPFAGKLAGWLKVEAGKSRCTIPHTIITDASATFARGIVDRGSANFDAPMG